MSFGDFEYQETTSNQLARILKGMRQEQVILDAVQNPIDDIEEYPDARIIESTKGTKDHIGAVTIPSSGKSWHFSNEPNQDTRLWLWFREGWRLRDYSRHGNDAFASQLEPAPYPVENYVPLRRKINDDGTTSGRLYGIIDGKSQYYRVHDGPENRMTDLLVTNTEICFSVFFSPWQTYVLDEDDCATVFQKLDDDQSNYAIRVCVMPDDGSVKYSLRCNGESYEITTAADVVPHLELPEFVPGQFIDEEFLTNSTTKQWQWNPDIQPTDWIWLFFTFNKTTRQLKIFKVAADNGTASLLTSSASEAGIRTTFAMHIPGNEGGSDTTTAYDIINDNDAVFDDDPVVGVTFEDGILHFGDDTANARIENHSSINALGTSFTIAFKANLDTYAVDAQEDEFLSKGFGGNAAVNAPSAGDYRFEMLESGSKTLRFRFMPDSGGAAQNITVANAFPTLNTWVNVILTYNGSTYSLEVDNLTPATLSASGNVFTNSEQLYLGDEFNSFHGYMADIIIDKGTAWGSTTKTWYKNRVPGFKAGFPDWKPPKPPEPETPLPVVRPVEEVYNVPLPATTPPLGTVKINGVQTTTPFVETYNVAGGTPATVPEELKYDVADGTTGGGSTVPISTIYNLAAASSTGAIDSDETAYVQRIVDTSSVLYNKKPTDLQFWINDSGGDCDGMAYPAIIRTNGTYTKIGAGMNVSSLTSTWVSISGVSYVDRTALAVGDGVGIVREGHSNGTLGVRRGGTDNHYDNAGGTIHSYQHLLVGTSFTTSNDQYSIAGVVKVGGETIPGTNPYVKMTSTNRRMAHYQLNSTLENIVPSKVIWRVRRVGSAASATLICTIRNASNVEVYRFPQTISFNTVSTTVQDLQFDFVDQTVQFADGFHINLEYDNITGINDSTVYLEVNYNVGPSNTGVFGGTAWKGRYYRNTAPAGYFDISPVCDLAGKVYIGGSSFTAYLELDNITTRAAEKVHQSVTPNISTLFDEKVSKFSPILKKSGSPTGPITIRIYDGSGNYVTTFDTTIDASTLTTSDATYVFVKPGQNFPMGQGYRIAVHYDTGTASDKVLVKINTNTAGGAAADGTKSILSKWNNSTFTWTDQDTLDISGIMYTGGIPDTTSRPRTSIRCDSIFSQVYAKKITRVKIPMQRLGSPTGTVFIRSMRGSDDSNRDLLGSVNIATLTDTSAWTHVDVTNFAALHFLGESDKIVVEYTGGDPSNCLIIPVNKASTYDDEDTIYDEYNGLQWLTGEHPDWDMVATLWTGGDTYTPDPGTLYVEPPDYYDHDLLIGGGAFVDDNQFTSFYGMRIRDFKIETSIPTLEEMDNLMDNKYSRRGGKGEVALVGYSTLNSETEPPP